MLAGDTSSKLLSVQDKCSVPLYGDAGSTTAFEKDSKTNDLLFDLRTNGIGKEAIILKDGEARTRITENSLGYIETDSGIKRNDCHLVLEGMDVFSFGIS